MKTLINFPCVAVLTVDHWNAPGEENDRPQLLGIWKDAEDAEIAIIGNETRRIADARKEDAKYPSPFGAREVKPLLYCRIPINQAHADSLDDLESSLEAAAVLYFDGIGVEK